jgi:uncharacterized protein (TIRG00374 family)
VKASFKYAGKAVLKNPVVMTALKYGIGFALLGWVIWMYWEPDPKTGSPGLRNAFRNGVNVGPLSVAVVLLVGGILLTFVRWHALVRAQGLPFSLVNAVRLGLVGYYFNTFLPGSVGGDIVKAAGIARQQSRRTVAVATVMLDRVIGLWGLCWVVALLGGTFWIAGYLPGNKEEFFKVVVASAWAIGVVTVALWVLLGHLPAWRAQRFAGRLERIPKVGGSLAELWRAVWMYRLQGKTVFVAVVLAIIGHIGFVMVFYFSALTLVPDSSQLPSAFEHYLIIPMGMAFQAVFFTPGGVGGGEAAFGWLYQQIGYSPDWGVVGSLVQRVISWGVGLVGYLVYLRMRPALKQAEVVLEDTTPASAVTHELSNGVETGSPNLPGDEVNERIYPGERKT